MIVYLHSLCQVCIIMLSDGSWRLIQNNAEVRMQQKIDRLAVSIPEAAEAIGVCRAQGYKMVAEGELPSIHVGRRRLVPIEGLRQYVEKRTQHSIEEKDA